MAYLVELMMNGVGPKPCIGGYESVKFSVRIFSVREFRGVLFRVMLLWSMLNLCMIQSTQNCLKAKQSQVFNLLKPFTAILISRIFTYKFKI